MKYIYFLFITVLFLSGCATTHSNKVVSFDNKEKKFVDAPAPEKPDLSPELENVNEKDMQDYAQHNGVIFAKTQFEGLLKTSYVQLKIVDTEHPDRSYLLHIGEKAAEHKFPWAVKSVSPGYFYIELPEGEYRISSISIPVGSTTAMEKADITFHVTPNAITYLGTLKMVGTKEKIKLGGELPLIKPGFEYTVAVLDQTEEAKTTFHERFPNVSSAITPQLMEIH